MLQTTVSVILAAGQGKRMCSKQSKLLHKALGRPLIHYPVGLSMALGTAHRTVVVGHEKDAIQSCVREIDANAQFAIQEQQLGTANAVLAAKDSTEGLENVLILSGDVPGLTQHTVEKMATIFTQGNELVAVLSFEPDDCTGYGRIVVDDQGRGVRIVEHKDASEQERSIRQCNSGIYLVNRDFLFDAISGINSNNAQNEFYLTDIIAAAVQAGKPPAVVLCTDPQEVAGVNDRIDLAEVTAHLRERKLNQVMTDGVTLLDPSRTWIDDDVQVAQDVVIHPHVSLRGNTSIGTGTHIAEGCVIVDAQIGEYVTLKPYCVINESTLGNHTQVGPFAHLRPGTQMADESKIGNFVESKKTVLGKGSKANHLTYLGDAEIGEGVNIGAGTITCNYDGVNKHKTVLSDGVFVGSNSALVAPVTLGQDVLVAAGSIVTEDAPDGALVVARQRQTNVDQWAAKNGPKARKQKTNKEG